MYRIELVPGEVTVFRTVEELATGVRNGLISPKARIYHSASDKWLPIEFHPHYKQALELASGRAAEPSASKPASTKPVERPRSDGLTFLNVPVSPTTPTSLTPAHPPVHHPTPAPRAPEPPPGPDPVARSHRMSDPVQLPWITPRPESAAPVAPDPVTPAPAKPDPVQPASPFAPPIVERGGHATATRTAQVDPRALVMYHAALEESGSEDSLPEEPGLEEPVAGETHPFEPVVLLDAPTLPPVRSSPVLELPKISYPEITPAERPVATRPPSAKRPLHLAGAILVLAVGGYASSTLLSFSRGTEGFAAASTVADRPVVPLQATEAPAQRAAQVSAPVGSGTASRATPQPAPTTVPTAPVVHTPTPVLPPARTPAAIARADSASLPPASSGFARALEARAIVTTPAKSASASAADSLPDAAPAIDMQVAMPAVPGADSLAAPRQKSDSTMKKILRALNGGKAP